MHTPQPIDRRALLALGVLAVWPGVARAAPPAWPSQPIRLVVPVPPGGGTDMLARALAQSLQARLNRPVLVDNRPGASTVIGSDLVAKAVPDGHTLLLVGSTSYTINSALRRKLPFDPARDLVPVAMVGRTPLVLTVRTQSPWATLGDLLTDARQRPEALRYASFGIGTGAHLAGELFARAAGIRLEVVHYKGSADAMLAVLGGQVDLGFDTAAAAAPQQQGGRLRVLAVVSPRRSRLLPEVPTATELHLPDATYDGWYLVAAPAATPAAVQSRLAGTLQSVLAGDPALLAQMARQGVEPVYAGAGALRQLVDDEIARNRALALRANIVLE